MLDSLLNSHAHIFHGNFTFGTIIYEEIYLRTSVFIQSISLMLMSHVAVAILLLYWWVMSDDNYDAWPWNSIRRKHVISIKPFLLTQTLVFTHHFQFPWLHSFLRAVVKYSRRAFPMCSSIMCCRFKLWKMHSFMLRNFQFHFGLPHSFTHSLTCAMLVSHNRIRHTVCVHCTHNLNIWRGLMICLSIYIFFSFSVFFSSPFHPYTNHFISFLYCLFSFLRFLLVLLLQGAAANNICYY